jgi:hypothetical protein
LCLSLRAMHHQESNSGHGGSHSPALHHQHSSKSKGDGHDVEHLSSLASRLEKMLERSEKQLESLMTLGAKR